MSNSENASHFEASRLIRNKALALRSQLLHQMGRHQEANALMPSTTEWEDSTKSAAEEAFSRFEAATPEPATKYTDAEVDEANEILRTARALRVKILHDLGRGAEAEQLQPLKLFRHI